MVFVVEDKRGALYGDTVMEQGAKLLRLALEQFLNEKSKDWPTFWAENGKDVGYPLIKDMVMEDGGNTPDLEKAGIIFFSYVVPWLNKEMREPVKALVDVQKELCRRERIGIQEDNFDEMANDFVQVMRKIAKHVKVSIPSYDTVQGKGTFAAHRRPKSQVADY